MAGDDMPAQFVADAQRALQVEPAADVPHARRGARQRLGARVDREPARRPVAAFVDAFIDDGQAGARTGDRRAQRNAVAIIGGADDQPRAAAILAPADRADAGADSRVPAFAYPTRIGTAPV